MGQHPGNQHKTLYVDNKLMIQAAHSQQGASATLQPRLKQQIELAEHLNIKFAPKKSKLMHLTPLPGLKREAQDTQSIQLYDVKITPKEHIKTVRVGIDD